MMTSVLLVLAMGCGNKETAEPQEQAKAASKPALPDSKKGQPTPKKETPKPQPKAADQKLGTLLWEFVTGEAVTATPAIGSNGTVFVGSYDKKLYAINGKSGVKLWEFETGFEMESSPAIGSDGTIYVGSGDFKLYAIKTDSKGPAKSPWPMRGQNPQHTGRAPAK